MTLESLESLDWLVSGDPTLHVCYLRTCGVQQHYIARSACYSKIGLHQSRLSAKMALTTRNKRRGSKTAKKKVKEPIHRKVPGFNAFMICRDSHPHVQFFSNPSYRHLLQQRYEMLWKEKARRRKSLAEKLPCLKRVFTYVIFRIRCNANSGGWQKLWQSLGWVRNIAPNTSTLTQLRTEIRLRIWKNAINAIVTGVWIAPFKD